jgi:hypothetical protein
MAARFRVATRATGIRRQVYVHVYDDREQMARAHHEGRGRVYDEARDGDTAGGLAVQTRAGWRWPRPDPGPVLVMRLWTGQLDIRTVAHESTHAANSLYFMDRMKGWDTRARSVLFGDDEPICYAVGDLTEDILGHLHHRGLLTDKERP